MIEPGAILETVYRFSSKDRHIWQECRVVAIDEGDVIIRWLSGPEEGYLEFVDDDPDFWREVCMYTECSRHCSCCKDCALQKQEERETENTLAALEYIKQEVRR